MTAEFAKTILQYILAELIGCGMHAIKQTLFANKRIIDKRKEMGQAMNSLVRHNSHLI